MTLRARLDASRLRMRETGAVLRRAMAAHGAAVNAFENLFNTAQTEALTTLSPGSYVESEHRRAHRPGRQPKIDADLELQAFLAARVDHMTFYELEAAVAQAFPEPRRVRKSAIHAWWQRTRDKTRPSGNHLTQTDGPG